MSTPLEIETLLQEMRLTQRQAWERGERVFVEAYLVHYPQVADHQDAVIDFIYSEFCLREDLGLHPDPKSISSDFPMRRRS